MNYEEIDSATADSQSKAIEMNAPYRVQKPDTVLQ